MIKKQKLKAVFPNEGIKLSYEKKLIQLIEEMNKSISYWVKVAYKNNPPEFAQDVSANDIQKYLRGVFRRWQRRFNEAAPELAKYFAQNVADRTETDLKNILRKSGISIKFQMGQTAKDALAAIVNENVSLIKSIPQQYLTNVEGLVMRSVLAGRDLQELTKELQHQYNVTYKRAVLIATDQNNKATSHILKIRQLDAGIEKAIWLHSHAGKTPRPTHVANNGKEYDIKTGWYDPHEKKYVWPGMLINCFPGDQLVNIPNKIEALWRTFFQGMLIDIELDGFISNNCRGTINHPILTQAGWRSLDSINTGDYVVCATFEENNIINNNINQNKFMFKDLFETLNIINGNISRNRSAFNFYGEVPQNDVDQIIVNNELLLNIKSRVFKNLSYFSFSESKRRIFYERFISSDINKIFLSFQSSISSEQFMLLWRFISSYKYISLLSSSDIYSILNENIHNSRFRNSEFSSNSKFSHTFDIEREDFLFRDRFSKPFRSSINFNTSFSDMFAEDVRIAFNRGRRSFNCGSFSYKFFRVVNKRFIKFSGHVYTLGTDTGYYNVGPFAMLAKNCRCASKPIVPGFS